MDRTHVSHTRTGRAARRTGAWFALLALALPTAPAAQDIAGQDENILAVNPIVENPVEIEITEWPVPWKDSRPRDPDVAPDGSVWLVGQGDDYVARFDPDSEEFTRLDLPVGSGPHNVIAARDGSLWIAGNRQGYIGRMNPGSGQMTRFDMPDESVRDPHTLVFSGDGHIWFTAQWANRIGRLDQRTGDVDFVPLHVEQSRPYGIRMDSKGQPWVALLGTHALATVNPRTLALELVHLPRPEARLRRLAITGDDLVWYTDYAQGYIGQYDPASGAFKEWKTPSEKAGPYAMAADKLGRVWFVETWPQPNLLVGFDPLFGTFFSVTPIPSGGGTVRHMVYDRSRDCLWFGTDANTLARADLP